MFREHISVATLSREGVFRHWGFIFFYLFFGTAPGVLVHS